MKHVFISYSRKDYDDFVKNLIADLQAAGIEVWVDKIGLPPGTPDWEEAIRKAIKEAQAVILVATVNSRKSEVVRDELEVARMEQIPIYPIWAKGEDGRYVDCIPLGYSYRQRVDMREGHYDEGLQTLLKALRGEDYHPVLDRVKRAAQEWDAAGRPDYLLWVWEQQAPVYEVIEQSQPDLDDITQAFLVPEYERLLKQFIDAPSHRQRTIIERWAEIGEPCIEIMCDALLNSRSALLISEVATRIIEILNLYRTNSILSLIHYLFHEKSSIREEAALVLGELKDERAVEPLIDRLRDEGKDVRRAASCVLGQLGDSRAVEPLINQLKDEAASVRAAVVSALGQLGDARAVEPLIDLLQDDAKDIRLAVVEALVELGDARAVEPLIDLLQDDAKDIRLAVVEALVELGDARAVEPLIDRLKDGEWYVRNRTAEALGRLGDERAVEPLIAIIKYNSKASHYDPIQINVIIALGKLNDHRAIQPLAHFLTKKNLVITASIGIYGYAASALEEIGTSEALKVLDNWKQEHPDLFQQWQKWKSNNR